MSFPPELSTISTVAALPPALLKLARALTARLDVDDVCSATLGALEEVFGATSSWILLCDSSKRALVSRMLRGLGSDAYRGVTVPCDAGIAGVVFSTRQPVFVPDVLSETRWHDTNRLWNSGLRSVLTLPLVHGDRVVGVIGLDSPRFTAEHPPAADDLACLESVAAQASIGIILAQLFESIEQDRRRLRALVKERRVMRSQIGQLRSEVREAYAIGRIVGVSERLKRVLQQAELVARADTTVLLLGETGSGKELLARLIHDQSGRAARAFVAVNCAALPETLVESELFGHEKGAFTGAITAKPGRFELAHQGTLFLDEVGDLVPEIQAKLLRVIEDGEVHRVGSTRPVRVNVRLLAATNRDLASDVDEGRFRADLYYRLMVFPLSIPPLRERPHDIPVLARHFTERFAKKMGKRVSDLSETALERLLEYHWPGNVRELQNVIERAVILTDGSVIRDQDILRPRPSLSGDGRPPGTATVLNFADAERRAIESALDRVDWRISGPAGAAKLLGLKPTTLHAKMKKLGIRRPRDSSGDAAAAGLRRSSAGSAGPQ
jgi:formate hydrogenlyase transcriptional activator